METPTLACLELSAEDVMVDEFPSGWWRSFWVSAELIKIIRTGSDVIVSIKGWEYWRLPNAVTDLCFREASVLVEMHPSGRQLCSLIQTTESDDRNRYVFLATDHQQCVELFAKDFVELD